MQSDQVLGSPVQGSLTASLGVAVAKIIRRLGLQDDAVVAISSAAGTVTVRPDPWDDIFGRYDEDPTWADFPGWLVEHRSNQS